MTSYANEMNIHLNVQIYTKRKDVEHVKSNF